MFLESNQIQELAEGSSFCVRVLKATYAILLFRGLQGQVLGRAKQTMNKLQEEPG